MPGHRAIYIGLLQTTMAPKGAGTIRVVFAAKLFEKFIPIHLVSLVYVVYLVSKLLPVPVPGHGRHKKKFLKKIGIGSKKKSYPRECPHRVDTH
jgi:hypothetical protein